MLVKNQEKITFILNVILFGPRIAQAQFLGKAVSSSGPSTWHLSIFEPNGWKELQEFRSCRMGRAGSAPAETSFLLREKI
jgi:hypothetical protein